MRASLLDHIANTQLRDDLLLLTEQPAPTRLAVVRIRHGLSKHIRYGGRHRRLGRAAIALGTVAVIVVAVVATMTLRSDPAEAIRNIAEAVAKIPNEDFTGATIERRLEQTILVVEPVDLDDPAAIEVAFHLPITEIHRTAPDGSFQTEETFGEPSFFQPLDDASIAVVRERYAVGETETSTYPPPDLPDEAALLTDDADLLAERINTQISRFGPPEIPHSVQIISIVGSIYNATLPTATERAALLEVLASTPGLDFPQPEDPDTVEAAVSYAYDDGTAVRLVIVFDARGWLVRETETLLDGIADLAVPPGTPVFDRRFTPPVVS
jgi:hypothetical protein